MREATSELEIVPLDLYCFVLLFEDFILLKLLNALGVGVFRLLLADRPPQLLPKSDNLLLVVVMGICKYADLACWEMKLLAAAKLFIPCPGPACVTEYV